MRFAISVPIGAWHPLLRDCLQSLAAQEGRAEVAVLDASGDRRVAETLDEFQNLFAYRRTGPDKGQSDAIIEGWKNTSAPILGWLNADDALYPNALAVAAAAFENEPSLDVVYGESTIIDDAGAYRGYHWAVSPPGPELLAGCIISQPSCFFRREAVDRIGGLNVDLHYTMDWDLWVRLWRAGAKFGFDDRILSRVLWSRDAKTGGFNARRREELNRIISAHPNAIRRAKSRLGFALHHTLEYFAPRWLASPLRRANRGHTRVINGFGRTGEIVEEATFPLVYYGEGAADRVEVTFAPNASGAINTAPDDFPTPIHGGKNEIKLDRNYEPGEVLNLHIKPEARTTFLGCQWISTLAAAEAPKQNNAVSG